MSELQKANPASPFLLSTGDELYPLPFDSYAKGRTASQKQPETGHKGENDQSNPDRTPRGAQGTTVSPAALPGSRSGQGKPSRFGSEQPKTGAPACPAPPVFSALKPQRSDQSPLSCSRRSVPDAYLCVFPKITNGGRSPNSHYGTGASLHKTVIS